MSENSDCGWIEHDGKGMPVKPLELVTVMFRDGEIFESPLEAYLWHSDEPGNSNWCNGQTEDDITAYRVVKPRTRPSFLPQLLPASPSWPSSDTRQQRVQ